MVAADWVKSDKREDDLAGRPGSIVQKYAAQGGPEFFLIINIQVPGSTTYSLALYFMMNTPLEDSPLLQSFVNGDDAFRNSRFKLIPYISKRRRDGGEGAYRRVDSNDEELPNWGQNWQGNSVLLGRSCRSRKKKICCKVNAT
ncbi:unnamed protein product [Linum trigynum]